MKYQDTTTHEYKIYNISKDQTCILKILLVLEEFALGTFIYTKGLVANTVNFEISKQ